jgi:hypothetical protein
MPVWRDKYPGVEELKVAVMGCIVNGPGESKHADIGISLPGTGETPAAPVFIDGKKAATLRGTHENAPAGEVVLLENESETVLEPGDAATFRAGIQIFHCLHNRSNKPATYLVVGTRTENDIVHYLDDGSRVERKGRKRTVFNAQGQIVREYEH